MPRHRAREEREQGVGISRPEGRVGPRGVGEVILEAQRGAPPALIGIESTVVPQWRLSTSLSASTTGKEKARVSIWGPRCGVTGIPRASFPLAQGVWNRS